MELWLVGKTLDYATKSWEFKGVFDNKQKAIDACHGERDFVGPAILNESLLDDEPVDWPNAFYPSL